MRVSVWHATHGKVCGRAVAGTVQLSAEIWVDVVRPGKRVVRVSLGGFWARSRAQFRSETHGAGTMAQERLPITRPTPG